MNLFANTSFDFMSLISSVRQRAIALLVVQELTLFKLGFFQLYEEKSRSSLEDQKLN